MNPAAASRLFPLLAAAVAGGFWLLLALTNQDLALGGGAAHALIEGAAVAATALFAIVAISRTLMALAPLQIGGVLNGFQRVLVYGAVTFAVCFFTLQYFGFDLRSVLTGSAIASAAVGLAMQPTLGSMIAGLTLQLDRVLRVGDAVVHEGERVRVLRLDWRVVVGARDDGRLVVIPNAKLADGGLLVSPAGQAVMGEVRFAADADEPPQRVCDLVREMVSDFVLVDAREPVLVAPVGLEPDHVLYSVRYWTRFDGRQALIEGELLRRLWYGFQRHQVAPRRGAPVAQPDVAAFESEIAESLAGDGGESADFAAEARRLAEVGRLLLFAPDERLVMPDWAEGWRILLLRGAAVESSEFLFAGSDPGAAPPVAVERLGRAAQVQRIAEALAARIGPYAEYAVARAADRIGDLDRLCRAVALEIDDVGARDTFLREVSVRPDEIARIDRQLTIRRNAAGDLAARGELRALTEVALLAAPPPAQAVARQT